MVSNINSSMYCSYLGLLFLLLLHTIDASNTSTINIEDYIYNDVLPITGTFRGPLDFDCTDGMCSYNTNNNSYNDCRDIFNNGNEIFRMEHNIQSSNVVVVSNMHGKYSIPMNKSIPSANASKATNNTCILSCQKCSAIPDTEIDDFGCAGNEKCCDTYNGFFYCHELGTCIDSTKQSCPINGTAAAAVRTYYGPTHVTCRNGGRCNTVLDSETAVDQCGLITAGNRSLFGHYFISGLEGEYHLPGGCVVSCDEGCTLSPLVLSDIPHGLILEPGPVILPFPTNTTDDDNNNTTRRRQLRGTIGGTYNKTKQNKTKQNKTKQNKID